MNLRVGRSGYFGDVARQAERFDLLEVRAEPGTLPRPSRLRDLRQNAPERCVFSVALSRKAASLAPGAEAQRAVEEAVKVAQGLQAAWLLLSTPASFAPSARARRRLGEFVAPLVQGPWRVGWEPAGVWEEQDAVRLASELGLSLVRDVGRNDPPPGDVVYARVRALGTGGRLGEAEAERVALRLAGRADAYVVLPAAGAAGGARLLKQTVERIEAEAQEQCEAGDELEA